MALRPILDRTFRRSHRPGRAKCRHPSARPVRCVVRVKQELVPRDISEEFALRRTDHPSDTRFGLLPLKDERDVRVDAEGLDLVVLHSGLEFFDVDGRDPG